MPNLDLNDAIQRMVSAEVERELGPYRELLQRLADFAGGRGGRRAAAPVRAAAKGGRRGARKAGAGDASRFKAGQAVRYKQGRGVFEATVVAVDADRNVLTLERAKDGKKVERPAAKIYEA